MDITATNAPGDVVKDEIMPSTLPLVQDQQKQVFHPSSSWSTSSYPKSESPAPPSLIEEADALDLDLVLPEIETSFDAVVESRFVGDTIILGTTTKKNLICHDDVIPIRRHRTRHGRSHTVCSSTTNEAVGSADVGSTLKSIRKRLFHHDDDIPEATEEEHYDDRRKVKRSRIEFDTAAANASTELKTTAVPPKTALVSFSIKPKPQDCSRRHHHTSSDSNLNQLFEKINCHDDQDNKSLTCSSTATAISTTAKAKAKANGIHKKKKNQSSSSKGRKRISTLWSFSVHPSCHTKSFNHHDGNSNNSDDKWKKSDFQFKSILGNGKFGTVWKVTSAKTCENSKQQTQEKIFAIKAIPKTKISSSTLKLLRNEIEIHSRLSHANILRFLGYFHDSSHMYLVMQEVLEPGELYKHLKGRPIEDSLASTYISQICQAVKYCHDQHVYHRDLKPENILLSSSSSRGVIKLCDFGWSIYAPKNHDKIRNTLCGTPVYVPPEMLCSEKAYNVTFVDLWAIGLLAYEMVLGETPFCCEGEGDNTKMNVEKKKKNNDSTCDSPHEEVFDRIKSFNESSLFLPSSSHTTSSPLFMDFVKNSLKVEPTQRLSIEEMVKHPWLT